MRRLLLGAVGAVVVGAGCEPIDLDNLLLSCRSDDECLDGLVCGDDGLCAPGTTVVVTPVDVVGSAASTTLIGRPFVAAGTPLTIAFTLNKAIETAPRVRLVAGAEDVVVVDAIADGTVEHGWIASFVVTGDEPETTARAEIDVFDDEIDATAPTTLATSTAVTFDYTGPEPVALSFQRLPDPQRTIVALDILDEKEVGPAIDVRLVFSSSEPVFLDGDVADDAAGIVAADDDRAPRVISVSGAAPLTFARDRRNTNPLIYALTWPDDVVDGGYDGVHTLQIRLVDLAGNITEAAVSPVDSDGDGAPDAAFVVDGTRPAVPAVDVADSVVFERAPWGRIDVDEPDLYRVIGRPGSAEPGSLVLVTRDATGVELDRVLVDDDGSFTAPDDGSGLTIADIETVFVRVADTAGNIGEPAAIRDVRWVVTPLGKIVGSDSENPHRLEAAPIFAGHLDQGGLRELGDLRETPAQTVGAGTWRLVDEPVASLVAGLEKIVADAAIATDPVRGFTLLLGQLVVGRGNDDGTGFVAQGSCGGFVNDVKVRGSDGRWRTGPPTPFQSPFTPPKATYAGSIGQIVVVTEGMRAFSFDGTTWRTLCNDDCAPALSFDQTPTSLVWDERRAVLVAVAGATVAELDVTATPARWRRAATLPQAMQALWDEENDVVVFAAGPRLLSWDGAAFGELCTGACAETAPPARAGAGLVRDEHNDTFVLFGGEGDVPCRIGTSNAVIQTRRLREEDPETGIEQAPNATRGPTETWTFAGARWTRHDVAGPGPRTQHAMSWDPLRRRVVLVGGDDCGCMALSREGLGDAIIEGFPDDTWEWDGASWTLLPNPAAPPSFSRETPPPLRDHSVVEGLGGAVIVGGGTALHVFRDDTWFTRTDARVGGRDPLLFTQPVVAASPTGQIFAVGGALQQGPAMTDGPPALISDVSAGSFASLCPGAGDAFSEPCAAPTRVWGAASWHDGDRLYVHGGVDQTTVGLVGSAPLPTTTDSGTDTLRSFRPDEGWSVRCDDGACAQDRPSRRLMHRAVLTSDGDVIVFGGIVDGSATSNETWRWDGETWTKLDGPSPPARAGHLMAWDAERDAVVVAYGADLPAPVQIQQPSAPSPRDLPVALSEVWELRDGVWSEAAQIDLEGDGRPSPRSSVAGAGLAGGGVVLFGGTPSPATTMAEVPDFPVETPRSNEVWVWQGGADDAPGHRFSVRADKRLSLLRPEDELTGLTFTWRTRAGRTNTGTASDRPHLVWWDGSGWIDVDDDDRIDCGVGCVSAHLGGAEARRALVNSTNSRLHVAVVADRNGLAPQRAVLESDNVEVQLTWRRPVPPITAP